MQRLRSQPLQRSYGLRTNEDTRSFPSIESGARTGFLFCSSIFILPQNNYFTYARLFVRLSSPDNDLMLIFKRTKPNAEMGVFGNFKLPEIRDLTYLVWLELHHSLVVSCLSLFEKKWQSSLGGCKYQTIVVNSITPISKLLTQDIFQGGFGIFTFGRCIRLNPKVVLTIHNRLKKAFEQSNWAENMLPKNPPLVQV